MFSSPRAPANYKETGVLCRLAFVILFAGGQLLLAQMPRKSNAEALTEITSALQYHDFGQALRLTDSALRSSPGDIRIWTLRGMSYSGLGEQDLALTAYKQALKISPEYLPALEGAAQVEYLDGNNGAKPLLERVLKLQPSDSTAHAMLGVLDYRAKNCPGAVGHFEQAGDNLASQPGVLIEYGACLTELKRFSDAVPVFERAFAAEPASVAARYNLALAQWKAGRIDDALGTVRPLIQEQTAPEYILTFAADIYESRGQTEEAIEILRRAMVAYPKDKDAYLDFANLAYNHASVQVGIDMLSVGLTQLPHDAEMYLSRGILYGQFGDMAKCLADLETANRLNPNLPLAGAAEGIAETQAHNPAEALKIFRAKARAHPSDALTQYLLAEALMGTGAAVGSPEYNEEVRAARLATRLDPTLTLAHDLLATIELEAGQTQAAIEQCEAALRMDPNDQQALYHLILAKRKAGQKTEIPALLARFSEVRKEEQIKSKSARVHPLVEQAPVAQSPAASN